MAAKGKAELEEAGWAAKGKGKEATGEEDWVVGAAVNAAGAEAAWAVAVVVADGGMVDAAVAVVEGASKGEGRWATVRSAACCRQPARKRPNRCAGPAATCQLHCTAAVCNSLPSQ